jgi:hypothetical protein
MLAAFRPQRGDRGTLSQSRMCLPGARRRCGTIQTSGRDRKHDSGTVPIACYDPPSANHQPANKKAESWNRRGEPSVVAAEARMLPTLTSFRKCRPPETRRGSHAAVYSRRGPHPQQS